MKRISIKKFLLAVAFTFLSALLILFGAKLPCKTVAYADTLTGFNCGSKFYLNIVYSDGGYTWDLYPYLDFDCPEEINNRLGDFKESASGFYDTVYGNVGVYLVRTDNLSTYDTKISTWGDSNYNLPSEYDCVPVLTEKLKNSLNYFSVRQDSVEKYFSSKVDVNKNYYYYFVVLKKKISEDYNLSGELVTAVCTYSELYKTSNYYYSSYKSCCDEFLNNNKSYGSWSLNDEYYLNKIQAYRSVAGYSTENTNVNVKFKYRNVVNDNADDIKTQTETYQVENLKSLSKSYVYGKVMQLCGKEQLSDFNVIRREVGYTVNGETESAFVQDEYTLLEANGYDYAFDASANEGTLSVTYGNFAAKDFSLSVRTNDELHSALYIRSGNITTANGLTTITFDTSNIKTRLSNNFGWNVDNTDFNNYVISNPHTGAVTFTKNYTGSDVTSITVSTSDTNLLADCSLRLEIEVVPPVELTVTVKYLELTYANGEFTETWKTKVLSDKIWSTSYTKINKLAFANGDENIGIPAQGEFITGKITVTGDNGENIERLVYDGVTLSPSDNSTATAMITVKYVRNTLFRVSDNVTGKYRFIKAYGNSVLYSGSDFIVEHDGYRVKSITSEKHEYASVTIPDGVYDWSNAKISVICQLSAGNVIPLEVLYTDSWQVNVEYLENYSRELSDGSKTPTGFAVKKIYGNEIKIKGDNDELTFADINAPTIDEIAKFLGKSSASELTVIGSFGTPKTVSVSFDNATDTFTMRLTYHDTTLKVIQADGSYDYVNIPVSCFDTWANGYGKDWSILVLNTKDNVVFGSAGDVERKDLYGYFYVSVFKEQVKNLDGLFAGYAADGCRSFYDCKKVVGSDLYKFCNDMGLLGTILCLGTNKIVQAAGETLHDDYGTYYSYFLFVDGTSTLNYSANNKADDYFDTSSAAQNTLENVVDTIKEFIDKGGVIVKFIQIVLGLIAALIIVKIVVKIVDVIVRATKGNKKK